MAFRCFTSACLFYYVRFTLTDLFLFSVVWRADFNVTVMTLPPLVRIFLVYALSSLSRARSPLFARAFFSIFLR